MATKKAKAKTKKEVGAEIAKLREMKPFVVQYTAFGDNNHHRIDAMIRALEEMNSDEDVDDAYPEESQMDISSHARDAMNWKIGQEEVSPSENWRSLDSRTKKAKKYDAMALYDATPEWLKKQGLTRKDAQRLFNALCTLADYEGQIKDAISRKIGGGHTHDHANVCEALRYLVDGE